MSEFPTFAVSGSMLGALNAAMLAGGGLARLGVLAEASLGDVVTEADIAEVRADLLARCGGIITDRNVIDALARLERCVGEPKSALGPMLAALETAQNNTQNRQSDLNDPASRLNQAFGEIDRLNDRIEQRFRALDQWTTEEEREQQRRNRAEYDAAVEAYRANPTAENEARVTATYGAMSNYDRELTDRAESRGAPTDQVDALRTDLRNRDDNFQNNVQSIFSGHDRQESAQAQTPAQAAADDMEVASALQAARQHRRSGLPGLNGVTLAEYTPPSMPLPAQVPPPNSAPALGA